MTAILTPRCYSGTKAQRLAFGVPIAYAGLTIWNETDTGLLYQWNAILAVWSGTSALSGTLSNDLPNAPHVATGTRPLATAVPLGTIWTASDCQYAGIAQDDPVSGPIWYQFVGGRSDATATADAPTVANRMGIYVPGTKKYTQATVAGQWCNCAGGTTQGGGGTIVASLGPGAMVAATALPINTVVMVAADGTLITYVAGGGNNPLGVLNASTASGNVTFRRYDY